MTTWSFSGHSSKCLQVLPVSVWQNIPKEREMHIWGVSGSRGEDIFILFNSQTIWSKKYVKLNKSTSGGNPWQ